jgi:N-ethylmaleimide reductase
MSTPLFSPFSLGPTPLANRIVMAPMTRSRAVGNLANDLMVQYYGLRASAGLIITEGISPSPDGLGYARIPGLFSQSQADSWRPVTDAVHRAGGGSLRN